MLRWALKKLNKILNYQILLIVMEGSCLADTLSKTNTINTYLQRIGSDLQIKLPKIVVVGENRTGKSSMLERLLNLEPLRLEGRHCRQPTNMPLEMTFKYAPQLIEPYAQIDDFVENGVPIKFTLKEFVIKMIELFNKYIDGSRNRIVERPIFVRFFSKDSPNLTVIDTPGYRISYNQSNPPNLSEKIILHYINQPSTIILSVMGANRDILGSTIHDYTSKADPNQRRTLACLTKVNIMDRGTDAVSILTNQQIAWRYGCVGLVNHQCIFEKTTVFQNNKTEQKFFRDAACYSKLPTDFWGISSLSKKLTMVLYMNIKDQLRNIFAYVKFKRTEITIKMNDLKQNPYKISDLSLPTYFSSLCSIINAFRQLLDSVCDHKCEDVGIKSIRTQLSIFLNQEYNNTGAKVTSWEDIERTIQENSYYFRNAKSENGIVVAYFLTFYLHKRIKAVVQPSTEKIYEAIKRVIETVLESNLSPSQAQFRIKIQELLHNTLLQNYNNLQQFISQILCSEQQEPFTNDSVFLQTDFNINCKTGKKNTCLQALNQNIQAYQRIAIKNLKELIPRQIINFLIVKTKQQLQVQANRQEQYEQLQIKLQQELTTHSETLKDINTLKQIISSDQMIMAAICSEDNPNQQQDAIYYQYEYGVNRRRRPYPQPNNIQPNNMIRNFQNIPPQFQNFFDPPTRFQNSQQQKKELSGNKEPQIQKKQLPKNNVPQIINKKKSFNRLFGI